jgi:hypothetical protein
LRKKVFPPNHIFFFEEIEIFFPPPSLSGGPAMATMCHHIATMVVAAAVEHRLYLKKLVKIFLSLLFLINTLQTLKNIIF